MSAGGLPVPAAPPAWEGPVLVEIRAGHAVALLDAFGIVPLALGSAVTMVLAAIRRQPGSKYMPRGGCPRHG